MTAEWSGGTIVLMARRFQLLADPSRLRVVFALLNGELTVTQLTGETGMSQSVVSYHVTQLTTGGILARRRRQHFVFYRIVDPTLPAVLDLLLRSLQRYELALMHDLTGAPTVGVGVF